MQVCFLYVYLKHKVDSCKIHSLTIAVLYNTMHSGSGLVDARFRLRDVGASRYLIFDDVY